MWENRFANACDAAKKFVSLGDELYCSQIRCQHEARRLGLTR